MAYENLVGMGQFRLPPKLATAFLQKMQEKRALDAAFSSSKQSSTSKTTRTSKTTESVSQKSEEAAEKAAQDAVEEAAETAEVEADNGEEALVSEEVEEPESFIERMPVWGWAAIGGGVLVLGIGIVALARK